MGNPCINHWSTTAIHWGWASSSARSGKDRDKKCFPMIWRQNFLAAHRQGYMVTSLDKGNVCAAKMCFFGVANGMLGWSAELWMPLTTLGMTEKWRPMAIALLQDICFEIGTPWQEFTTHATLLAMWEFFFLVTTWRVTKLLDTWNLRQIPLNLRARAYCQAASCWKILEGCSTGERRCKFVPLQLLQQKIILCIGVASKCAPSSKFQPWHQPNFGLYHVVSQEWNISWHCTTWTQ